MSRSQALLMRFGGWLLLLPGLVLCLACAGRVVAAETEKPSRTLEQILKRGAIHVGVKTDFAPFGQLNAKGEPEGFEIDLAAYIARQLGVRLVLISASTANRFQRLEQGDIDILVATTADTQERRQVATALEPNYYAGGVSVLLRPEQRIADWQALRGQNICATQGAYFNRPMSQRYLLKLDLYRSVRDALLALHDGRCIGFLYSSAAIQAYLKSPEWAGYKSDLPLAMVAPWAINIARKEQGSRFQFLLEDMLVDWHRSGFLIEREKAWGIQSTKFLRDAHDLWSRKAADGSFLCRREATGNWPAACRNPAFVRSSDVGGLRALGLWIQENLGVNLTFVYDPYDHGLFLRGIGYTFILMSGCILLSLALGLLFAFVVEARLPWISAVTRGIAIYGRMTPPLLQMYLLFFGAGTLASASFGISVSPLLVALWCLSYYTGAAIMTVLLDAADHMRSRHPDFRVSRQSLVHLVELTRAPIKSVLVNVTKQTVLASALAIPELLSATTSIMADQGNVSLMMNVFLFTFMLLIALWMRILDAVEHKLKVKRREHHEPR